VSPISVLSVIRAPGVGNANRWALARPDCARRLNAEPTSAATNDRSVPAEDAASAWLRDHGCRLANCFLTIVGSAFLFSEFPGASYLVEPTVVKFIFEEFPF